MWPWPSPPKFRPHSGQTNTKWISSHKFLDPLLLVLVPAFVGSSSLFMLLSFLQLFCFLFVFFLVFLLICLFFVCSSTAWGDPTQMTGVSSPRTNQLTVLFFLPRFYCYCCCFSVVQIWNSLPFALRHNPSLPAFKTSLRTDLSKQYFHQ